MFFELSKLYIATELRNFLNCSPQIYQVVNKSLRELKLNMGNNLLAPNIVKAL